MSREAGESEGEGLLAAHAAGRLNPQPVVLPTLPERATPAMWKVAEFFALYYGLRLAADEDRPVPFACGWVGEKIGLPKKTVNRALHGLCRAKVLERGEQLPGRNGRIGTYTYAPRVPAGGEGATVYPPVGAGVCAIAGNGDPPAPPWPPTGPKPSDGANDDALIARLIAEFDAEELDAEEAERIRRGNPSSGVPPLFWHFGKRAEW